VGDVGFEIAVAAGSICVWSQIAGIAGDEQYFWIGYVSPPGCFAILFCAQKTGLDKLGRLLAPIALRLKLFDRAG
jgi:hypothetical protein